MITIPVYEDGELYLLSQEEEISKKKQLKILKEHDGMVIVLNIPKTVKQMVHTKVKQQLSSYPDGIFRIVEPEDYHITLFYFQDTGSMFKILKAAEQLSEELPSLKVRFGGIIRFAKVVDRGRSAIAAQIDAKEIQKFRILFQERLEAVDVTIEDEHGYIPHMTLAYVQRGEYLGGNIRLPKMKFEVSSVGVWIGADRRAYDLNMDEVMRSVELRVSRYKEEHVTAPSTDVDDNAFIVKRKKQV